MAFCKECGQKLKDGAKFCGSCGERVRELTNETNTERKVFFDGEIRKCINCGSTMKAFALYCDSCGYEFRGVTALSSLKKFREKLEEIDRKCISIKSSSYTYSYKYIQRTNDEDCGKLLKEKISLISTFPIPNAKEDILEFMILAASNFDAKYYMSHLLEEDLSDAWLAKIKQCFFKANLILKDNPALIEIKSIYDSTMAKISSIEKPKRKSFFNRY